MSSLDNFSEEQLAQALEARRLKRERVEAAERARKASLPQELVPNSPSPRKKLRTDSFPSSSSRLNLSRPPSLSFFDKPKLERNFKGDDGRVELLSSKKRESQFVSHESALPKSFADRLAEEKAIAAAQAKRKEKQHAERSRGFGDLSRESKGVLMGGKTGSVELLERGERKRGMREKEKGKGKGREKEEEKEDEGTALFRQAAASGSGGGGIGRPAPKPSTSSTLPSTSRSASPPPSPKPSRRDSLSPSALEDDLEITDGPSKRSRNKDGTVIEEIELGPKEFKPLKDDSGWERIEPYSGIKLRKRLLPHSTVNDLLDGRYHLTPSQIYSLARIDSRQRVDLDVETVDSDWVVIGVLAQKGEVRFLNSNPYGASGKAGEGKREGKEGGEEEEKEGGEEGGKKKKGGGKGGNGGSGGNDSLFRPPTARKRAQKYLRFDLIDFSTPRASSSGTGKLGVMLVEADSADTAVDEDGNETKVYKGQSGGAYEKFWKETPGAVVAIMNPVFLPYSAKFPTYTLKPTSADSMVVIGRADHLAFCDATTKEGKVCGSWVDDRTGKFCEYHIKRAVQRAGNSRPETYANTASLTKQGSMNLSQFQKSFSAAKPSSSSSSSKLVPSGVSVHGGGGLKREPGLDKPAQNRPGVLFGTTVHVTSGSRSSSSSTISLRSSNLLPSSLSSAPGSSKHGGSFIPGLREGPSVSEEKKRLKRQAEEDKKARRELRELVGRDRGKTNGGEMVRLAGERMKKVSQGKGKEKGEGEKEKRDDGEEEGEEKKSRRRSVLSGLAARKIGFDPTARAGEVERDESKEGKEFRSLLESGLASSGPREFDLSAPPGAKIRSIGVPAPAGGVKREKGKKEVAKEKEERMVDLDDDDDGLLIEGGPVGRPKISLAGLSRN
ncbi:hypothetical protein JCM8547_001507 [Rhodosporidiobolus lusitaniae]